MHQVAAEKKIEVWKEHRLLTRPCWSDIWYQQHFATQRSLKPKAELFWQLTTCY